MRYFGLSCALVFVLLVSGCGNVFIRGNFNSNTQTASGTVSIVQLTFVLDEHNVSTQVTVVTLIDNFVPSTFMFCGDQTGQFTVNEFAKATFTPGTTCSNLLRVIVEIG